MKFIKLNLFVILLLATGVLTQCKDAKKNWTGEYQGTLPCADCQGINTKITLKKDETFRIEQHYLGTKDTSKTKIFTEMGKFKWNSTDSVISLQNKLKQKFKVGQGKLFWLNLEGDKIQSELADKYVLHKIEE